MVLLLVGLGVTPTELVELVIKEFEWEVSYLHCNLPNNEFDGPNTDESVLIERNGSLSEHTSNK